MQLKSKGVLWGAISRDIGRGGGWWPCVVIGDTLLGSYDALKTVKNFKQDGL